MDGGEVAALLTHDELLALPADARTTASGIPLVQGVPAASHTAPPYWAERARALDIASGARVALEGRAAPLLAGPVSLAECRAPSAAESAVVSDAAARDLLEGMLLAPCTDPASAGEAVALRLEERAWRERAGPLQCPGAAHATSLEGCAHDFRECMTAFAARQREYGHLLGRLNPANAFAVDQEVLLRQEMTLLARCAAFYFAAFNRATGVEAPVTMEAMLARFNEGS